MSCHPHPTRPEFQRACHSHFWATTDGPGAAAIVVGTIESALQALQLWVSGTCLWHQMVCPSSSTSRALSWSLWRKTERWFLTTDVCPRSKVTFPGSNIPRGECCREDPEGQFDLRRKTVGVRWGRQACRCFQHSVQGDWRAHPHPSTRAHLCHCTWEGTNCPNGLLGSAPAKMQPNNCVPKSPLPRLALLPARPPPAQYLLVLGAEPPIAAPLFLVTCWLLLLRRLDREERDGSNVEERRVVAEGGPHAPRFLSCSIPLFSNPSQRVRRRGSA